MIQPAVEITKTLGGEGRQLYQIRERGGLRLDHLRSCCQAGSSPIRDEGEALLIKVLHPNDGENIVSPANYLFAKA